MNRADTYLLYGSTDTGKTSQLGEIAQWEWKHNQRISRLISADSGWDPMEHLVVSPERPIGTKNPDGSSVCVEAWSIQGLANPWVILIELSEGAWPQVVDASGIQKLRMAKAKWENGWVTSGGYLVGQVFLEGLSTIATVGMQDHINTGRKLSQDVVGTFTSVVQEVGPDGKNETSRSIQLSSAAMSHYGQVQRWLLDDLVPRFGKLGVSRVVWTAHEARGTDEITGISNSVLGPATVGKAVVDKTTLKFGHSFHMTVDTQIQKDPKGAMNVSRDFRAWFVSHPDSVLTKMNWPAKVSLPIQRSKELLKKFPGGFLPLSGDGSMVQFLEFLSNEGK